MSEKIDMEDFLMKNVRIIAELPQEIFSYEEFKKVMKIEVDWPNKVLDSNVNIFLTFLKAEEAVNL
jgi:hypothetical protein